MRKQPNINCTHFINDYGGRCGYNKPPDEERIFMFLNCKLVGQGSYCKDQVEHKKPPAPAAPPRRK